MGTAIKQSEKKIDGYSFKKVIGQASGKFKQHSQTITYVYEKKPERAGNVTVTYQDKNGKTLAPSKILTGKVGERYHAKAKSIKGYKLVSYPKNVKGSFTKKEQTVRFIYQYHKNKH
ncbi:MucBP domain-containing protein [Listeria aquatica]|uniref:Internalin-J n=1 Tax=Listeria aquatica FSL S10-1188 TaxID=1265818 RepID=W7BNB7_9LIST|nr:MucBP domain-containing protein [Listeria aquatica]EUJ21543.1 Internalin-J [Listeria aquatica FSL S10-1188]